MDSNSNSSEMYFPKTELDSDSERESDSTKKNSKLYWNSENTMSLIRTIEKDCRELWDTKHPLNKDRAARQMKLEYLAGIFGTTADEISRKMHNLRTQFNNELRKIKRRQCSEGAVTSGWEYFEALYFLRAPSEDPLDTVNSFNIELAEFQANEEIKFGVASRAQSSTTNLSSADQPKPPLRVAASGPPPLPPSANPLLWPEEALPRLRSTHIYNLDECQVFGDFVASELRMLRSNEARKNLKRTIQKAILQVAEEEDNNVSSE